MGIEKAVIGEWDAYRGKVHFLDRPGFKDGQQILMVPYDAFVRFLLKSAEAPTAATAAIADGEFSYTVFLDHEQENTRYPLNNSLKRYMLPEHGEEG